MDVKPKKANLIKRITRSKKAVSTVLLTALLLLLAFTLRGMKYALLVLLAAAIHEGGHIFFAWLLGVRLIKVRGSLFGLWLKYDFSEKSYLAQLVVSVAGAAFNVAACVITLLVLPPQSLGGVFFIFSNLALALFNLMPVSRFDGMGVLRCLCLLLTSDLTKADTVCRLVGSVFSFAFFLLTVYVQMRVGVSLSMLVLSVFLLYTLVEGGGWE